MTDFSRNKKTALALGNFDGLHDGHLQVLAAVAQQKENGFIPVMVRFDPHPAVLLHGKAPDRIISDRQRSEILASYAIEECVLDFEQICELSPERFVTDILIERCNAGFVSCGFNYRFGKNGAGTAKILKDIAGQYGIQCYIAPEVTFANEAVSATRIRTCLKEGNVEQANAMLTRPFSYEYEVVGGDRRGRLMGTPTINQFFPDGFLVPKHGVYASFVILDEEVHAAVTNIGMRPTFNGTSERSETWIMDFSGDLYGQYVQVYLLSYLRNEVKFDNTDALRSQILSDSQSSRKAVEKFLKKIKKIEKKA